jgi:hypothetical protein
MNGVSCIVKRVSDEVAPLKKSTLHQTRNQFQLGSEAIPSMMQYQAGLSFTMNTASLKGHWVNEKGEYYDFTGTIDPICPVKGKLICGKCDQGVEFTLPAVSFLDDSTKIAWRKPPDEIMKQWLAELDSQDHIRSMKRAERMMEEYLHSCNCDPDPKDIALILDGNGENRRGMEKALENAGIPKSKWMSIITMEINPEVALVNKIMFGECIVFTGADAGFYSKSLVSSKMSGVPVEHLIEKSNDLLTDEMKKRVKIYYGDYCGGPAGNQKVAICKKAQARVMAQLPNCEVVGVTISHRQHAHDFMHYVAIPNVFEEFACFTDNPRVKCKMFSKYQAQRSREEVAAASRELREAREAREAAEAAEAAAKAVPVVGYAAQIDPTMPVVYNPTLLGAATAAAAALEGHKRLCPDPAADEMETPEAPAELPTPTRHLTAKSKFLAKEGHTKEMWVQKQAGAAAKRKETRKRKMDEAADVDQKLVKLVQLATSLGATEEQIEAILTVV